MECVPDPTEGDWSFFGCYLTNGAPCGSEDFSISYIGNASSQSNLDDGDPYTLINEDITAGASTPTSASSTVSAVSSTLGSIPSHTHSVSASPKITHTPSKATIGAIAGGFTGGLVGTAALLGCLILYFRRRKTRQAKSTAPNNEPTIKGNIPSSPLDVPPQPSHIPTNANPPPQNQFP